MDAFAAGFRREQDEQDAHPNIVPEEFRGAVWETVEQMDAANEALMDEEVERSLEDWEGDECDQEQMQVAAQELADLIDKTFAEKPASKQFHAMLAKVASMPEYSDDIEQMLIAFYNLWPVLHEINDELEKKPVDGNKIQCTQCYKWTAKKAMSRHLRDACKGVPCTMDVWMLVLSVFTGHRKNIVQESSSKREHVEMRTFFTTFVPQPPVTEYRFSEVFLPSLNALNLASVPNCSLTTYDNQCEALAKLYEGAELRREIRKYVMEDPVFLFTHNTHCAAKLWHEVRLPVVKRLSLCPEFQSEWQSHG